MQFGRELLREKISALSFSIDIDEVQRLVDCYIVADKFERHVDVFDLRMLTWIFYPFYAGFVVPVDSDGLTIARFTS